MADISNAQKDSIVIEGRNGIDLVINSDGSISTSAAITTPPTSTAISQVAFGFVATTIGLDLNYTITNGKTLTLQRFSAAAADATGGAAIELFYDPNGDLSVLTRIETIILNGATYQASLNQLFVGNGIRRIILRRRGYVNSSREIFARWEGYEQ